MTIKSPAITIIKYIIVIAIFVLVFVYLFWLVKLFSGSSGQATQGNKPCESMGGTCGVGKGCVYDLAGNTETQLSGQSALNLRGKCPENETCCPKGTTAK